MGEDIKDSWRDVDSFWFYEGYLELDSGFVVWQVEAPRRRGLR